jgi:CRP-like cAMP-binding protein
MPQPDPVALSALFTTLRYLHPLSPEAELYLQRHVMTCSIGKRKLLIREGVLCEHVYFVVKGALRGFTREGQKDITTWITIENEMVTSILSFDERNVPIENIQALEKCELLALTYADLQVMYERFPESNILARKIFQRYYADAEKRAFIARLTKAENKYRYFLLRHRDLANRIPLKYIASYLGVTLETLSRIRKKFSSKQ